MYTCRPQYTSCTCGPPYIVYMWSFIPNICTDLPNPLQLGLSTLTTAGMKTLQDDQDLSTQYYIHIPYMSNMILYTGCLQMNAMFIIEIN